ncbi:mitogen-activated protein kinase kinase kinase 18-like [Silene latifolia]|uniref:mitogen-activated protein kinase kinase kinase 18-like n=1 Tax=Silene latifolia TaxID=37657 RepID=UPI003D78093A
MDGKIIGNGSYGVVTLGSLDGELIAVKSAVKGSISSVDSLNNEIDILRTLSSPYIVKYYGDEETTSSRKLLMEYVRNGDVARGGKVSDVELIRSYTWCLVTALREVHGKKIVHCDVKGSNVLVDPTNRVAKLADFGSAKRVEDRELSKMVPRGTPLWMAPEVVRGELQGYESDVWSLGCTVIEMFTGLPAWQDNGVHTLYTIGYTCELPEYPVGLPELGRDFLDKCLVRKVGQRWSCDQLLQHPFLLPATAVEKVLEPSPRSVFDWEGENEFNFSDRGEKDNVSARGRIGELATSVGVNWESDGWVEVRECANESVYVPGVKSEFHISYDPTWINLSSEINEVENSGGGNGNGDGGSICRQVKNMTVVMEEFIILLRILLISTGALNCSTSIGLVPNVIIIILLLIRLIRIRMRIQCFWNKFVCLASSMLFPFCLLFELGELFCLVCLMS